MNHYINKLVLFTAGFSLTASALAADPALKTPQQKAGYAIGVQIGNNLKNQGITDVDSKAVGQAIEDVLGDKTLKMSQQDMQAALNAYQQEMAKKQQAKAETEKKKGDAFRAKNAKRKGVKTTQSGIQYEIIKAGNGDKPAAADTVTVHYHGTLIDGTVFDSSVKRGQPATFPLNGVIKGWQEIVQMMPVGSKWKVVIPPELAYGERGAGGSIGPNATLIFDIELLSIKK